MKLLAVILAAGLLALVSGSPDKRPSNYRQAPRQYAPPQPQYQQPPKPQYEQPEEQYPAPAVEEPKYEQPAAPKPQYPAPQQYQAPKPQYPAPQQYQAPKPQYPAPQQYQAPKPQYPAPKPQYPAPQKPAYQPKPKYQPAYVPAQTQQYAQAAQAPASYAPKKVVAILSQDFQLDNYGYKYNYETEDYQTKEETAKIIPGTPKQSKYGEYEEDDGNLQVAGSYYYVAPDGTRITLRYEADENGFRPSGDHLPVAPELTPEVAQATAEHQAAVLEAQSKQTYKQQASYQQPQYQPAPQPQYYQ